MIRAFYYSCGILLFSLLLSACNTATTLPNPADRPNVKAADYNVRLGLAYMQKNQYTRARSKLLLALKQGPHYPEAYDAMAYFLEKTGQVEQADYYYRKALSFNEAAGKSQNNYGAYLCRQGHFQQAIGHFMQAVNDKNYLTPAAAYENAGYCALEIPNTVLAKKFFTRAIEENPNRAMSYLELGQIDYEQNQYPQAKQYLKQYRRLASPGPESLWLRVRLERKLGNLNAADSAALLLKGKFPNSAEAKLLKASNWL